MAYVAMTQMEESENLATVCRILNDPSERLQDWKEKNWGYDDAMWLRRIVRAWMPTHDLRKLETKDRVRLVKFTEKIHVTMEPNGRLLIVNFYGQDTPAMVFAQLLRNSKNNRLREPCAKCNRWYTSQDDRAERSYCSRRCAGSYMHARKRKRDHERKLKKAQKAFNNYPNRPIRVSNDWKQYVSKATGISKKFLTVAVRNGELMEPEMVAGPAEKGIAVGE